MITRGCLIYSIGSHAMSHNIQELISRLIPIVKWQEIYLSLHLHVHTNPKYIKLKHDLPDCCSFGSLELKLLAEITKGLLFIADPYLNDTIWLLKSLKESKCYL